MRSRARPVPAGLPADPGEHTRQYFGRYSNAARGKRRKTAASDGADPAAGTDSDTEGSRRECRRSRARLIQKVYEVDPLACPDCGGRLKVIAFIHAPHTIRRESAREVGDGVVRHVQANHGRTRWPRRSWASWPPYTRIPQGSPERSR